MEKRSHIGKIMAKYNLLFVFAGILVFFSILKPETYLTVMNVKSILNYQAISIILALAVMIPIAAGHFDLSVGYDCCLLHILTVGLMVKQGLPFGLVILIVLAIGAGIGLVNGLLVTKVGIDSFIATLGVGTVVYAMAYWYSNGVQVIGQLPDAFCALSGEVFGIPVTFLFAIAAAVIVWIVTEHLPAGRYFYFLGANKDAAKLSGIPAERYTRIAFVYSGFMAAVASILLASLLRVGQTTVGPDYLMSSFAGALMGTVAFKPGKVNVPGTITSVLLMAFAVSGLQQMGSAYFVQPLFNGSMLILAVSLAEVIKKVNAKKADEERDRKIIESVDRAAAKLREKTAGASGMMQPGQAAGH